MVSVSTSNKCPWPNGKPVPAAVQLQGQHKMVRGEGICGAKKQFLLTVFILSCCCCLAVTHPTGGSRKSSGPGIAVSFSLLAPL